MSLNTSDWWRLIRDFKNWFLHKSVQLGVSITDQIWLLSRTLPCFRSDSLWIKKGELAVLIMIIALCCFLLSHLFVQGLFFPLENLSFFTSPPPPDNHDSSYRQISYGSWNQQWPWHLVLLMVALTRVFWMTLKTFCILYQRHHTRTFFWETVASWTQAQFLLRNARFISSDLRLSRGPRNAGLQFERLGI